uniref:Uncharacterized protein n=1 Tax=Homalodisca liturata TaxID=320908 RepID=A0A1B6HCK7_9HEMI
MISSQICVTDDVERASTRAFATSAASRNASESSIRDKNPTVASDLVNPGLMFVTLIVLFFSASSLLRHWAMAFTACLVPMYIFAVRYSVVCPARLQEHKTNTIIYDQFEILHRTLFD